MYITFRRTKKNYGTLYMLLHSLTIEMIQKERILLTKKLMKLTQTENLEKKKPQNNFITKSNINCHFNNGLNRQSYSF